ncbi:endogenous retrovirus group K member 8 Pro protein-like [Dasypus novemcinctus]|uniref:endogenous retrovirus group K member 8 Pro protein-like n=1 Tax=Dasypus novemcinctus TaxID=9361 RepID=UPI0039C97F0C
MRVLWSVPIAPSTKPLLSIQVSGRWLTGLLDTGAEISCIPFDQAGHLPLTDGPLVVGATGQAPSQQVAQDVVWRDAEGRQGTFRPLVLKEISQVLWGRDILHQSGAILTASPPQLPPQ